MCCVGAPSSPRVLCEVRVGIFSNAMIRRLHTNNQKQWNWAPSKMALFLSPLQPLARHHFEKARFQHARTVLEYDGKLGAAAVA